MTAIEFRLLGPLEVVVGGRPAPLGGVKPRALLAALALEPGVTVSGDGLADVLWPQGPPRSAAANIRTYVHTLRRVLARHDAGLADRIESRSAGYALRAAPEEVDRAVFESLVAAAHRALEAGEPTAALADLARAERLWRGSVLADLPHAHGWSAPLARLTEQRLAAQELRTRVQIELGRYDDAVVELRGLLTDDPLREERWTQLVTALDAAGRRAEALGAYAEAERVLRAELATGPGPRLRRIRSSLASVADVQRAPVCQLPLDLPDFTGRQAEVDRLVGLLRARGRDNLPAVAVVTGPPGVGKTAVAVRVAHAVRELFPDGQLHVDLGGTTDNPRRPADVLAELLRALCVPEAALSRDLSGRAALLRSRLAGARVLVLLDDAGEAAQVRPLLPGAGASAVLVTNRGRMPDLAGAHTVELDVLPPAEAADLLAGVIGADRVAAEPAGAAAILESCGCLPLAIRIVGARLANRPNWTLGRIAERLADERRLLDELRVGDLAVRASVALSYEQLPGTAARAFRSLGLIGRERFPAWVVAALLDRPEADDVLDALVDAHLVEQTEPDIIGEPLYRLHDLLRVYAREQVDAEPHAVRAAAVRRIAEGYLTLASQAAKGLPADYFGLVPEWDAEWDATSAWHARPPAALTSDAARWYDAAGRIGVIGVSGAVEWGHDDLAWRIAATLAPYFDLRGRHEDWLATHRVALDAARRAGDERGQAIVLRNLGQVHLYQDGYAEARAAFETSRELFARVGDEHGAAVALAGTLTVARVLGEHDDALERGRRALAVFVRLGDGRREAALRLSLGSAHLALGDHDEAGRWFADALALAESLGDRHRAAHARHRLAGLARLRGRLDEARELLDAAITAFDELGDHKCVVYSHQALGEVHLLDGDLAHAEVLLGNCLAAHHRHRDRRSAARVCELLGELHQRSRRPELARGHFEAALALWRELAAETEERALLARLRTAPA
ncbi:AfsR/SARP family transcriptional regulator [Saccharothrix algeriensis]|uniref:DNA-binding SARP family transcriptional activator n=1 Tax=Saccharothrix algeriensis TaxID=173560 RepID=A0A8T8I135_9PSEU|nr:BTAD domain-containing putative transcriptional regulator [Saccharothrix algeriensis]MBM7809924.1 DNA-binding SARP family transcriptional activator [Saccharothrix algeriensis]QTR04170.1 tetratricopeptide repeat protein [Saccharothrix algeriensis]